MRRVQALVREHAGIETRTRDSPGRLLKMTTPHPKITERRAEVEDQSQRSRQRRLIALCCVLFVAILLAGASTQSALLDVDEIRMVGARAGARRLPARRLLGVALGTPLLGLDTGQIEDAADGLP